MRLSPPGNRAAACAALNRIAVFRHFTAWEYLQHGNFFYSCVTLQRDSFPVGCFYILYCCIRNVVQPTDCCEKSMARFCFRSVSLICRDGVPMKVKKTILCVDDNDQ